MQKIITRVLSRLGLESAIKARVFDSGELVIASDTPRVVVGDGVTLGGRSLSLKYTVTTDLSTIKDNVYAGDLIFINNELYRSNVSGFLQPSLTLSDLTSMSSEVDNFTLARDVDGLYSIKDSGISSAKINTSVIGNGLTRTTSTSAIFVNVNNTQFAFDGGGQISIVGAAAFPVRYDSPQGLNSTQQTQARQNINALAVNGDGTALTGIAKLAGNNTFTGVNAFSNTVAFDNDTSFNSTALFTGSDISRTTAIPDGDNSTQLINSTWVNRKIPTFYGTISTITVPGLDSGVNEITAIVALTNYIGGSPSSLGAGPGSPLSYSLDNVLDTGLSVKQVVFGPGDNATVILKNDNGSDEILPAMTIFVTLTGSNATP